jgi:hypothetical protein
MPGTGTGVKDEGLVFVGVLGCDDSEASIALRRSDIDCQLLGLFETLMPSWIASWDEDPT